MGFASCHLMTFLARGGADSSAISWAFRPSLSFSWLPSFIFTGLFFLFLTYGRRLGFS